MTDLDLVDIRKLAEEFAEAYKQAIIDSGHSASGQLVRSIQPVVKYENDQVILTITGEDYAVYLENGTKPHFPPVSKILEWIRVKPVLPRPINGKMPTAPQLAYLIGRKISRVGTKPTHLMANTANQMQLSSRLAEEISKALTKQFDDENIKDFFEK